jgi:ubiquinone/menaquinone biosynthesis methyltransferase
MSSAAQDAKLVPDVRRRQGGDGHASAVRAMFGRIAPNYDRVNHALSGGLDILWRRSAVAALSGAPRGPTLDLCAGTLDLTLLLSRARPGERLVALDFSQPMLEAGRHKVPRAELLVADAESLPLPSASFAAVCCGFGVRNVNDPLRALREVRRVLREGGVFVTLEFFRPETAVGKALHTTYASRLLPFVGGALSKDRGAYEYLAKSMQGFLSRTEYEQALLGAGFARVRSKSLTLGLASIVRAEVPS